MLDTCQLLASLRVLDVGGAEADGVGRLLADLGADVLKIEPPGGSRARHRGPTVSGTSISFALDNANKRSAELDGTVAADRDRLLALVADADVLIDGGTPGGLAVFGTSAAELAGRFDHLVALSVTDFGTTGPHAAWQATDSVLYAMSTALSRSGPTVGRPVLPPDGIASATTAAQAAWAVLVAYYHRLRCGTGDYVDVARFEAVVQSLDPPFGSEGQAAVGLKTSRQLWRGRPRNQQIYPTFPCRDGHVRICLLSARQWRGMRAWLGEPEQFADPTFDTIGARYAASADLNALIAARFADRSMDDLVAEGQARGVPIAAVLSPAEALAGEHLRVVGALAHVELTEGSPLDVPVGAFVVDGVHAGLRHHAPPAGRDRPEWLARGHRAPDAAHAPATGRPLDGVRILDLGVIVAGGELGRLFADLGADVIKVESAAYPDGLRQTAPGHVMSRSWALTHRNERSLGLDLRHPDGAAIFRRLVASADAVFANFKPGTLDSLGFTHDDLHAANPRVVLAESSAFGATGPWSSRMGYGPLVRATTGVTRLWSDRQPGADGTAEGFHDATTVFPDHVAARLVAVAALAALIARRDTASRVHVSQAEVAVNQLAASYVADAARAAGADLLTDGAFDAVLPCAGDDEWCVVSVTSVAQRRALAAAAGLTDTPVSDAALVDAVAAWTAELDKTDATRLLQAAAVPAGPMNRAADVLADPHLAARAVFGEMIHPLFDAPMPTEVHPAPFRRIPDADLRPAPMPGEHTEEICREVLDLTADDVTDLAAAGVVFTWAGAESTASVDQPNPPSRKVRP